MSEWLVRSRVGSAPSEGQLAVLRNHDPGQWETLGRQEFVAAILWNKPPRNFGALWYQCGNDWERWCRWNWREWYCADGGNSGDEPKRNVRSILAVRPDNLCILETQQEAADFFQEYKPAPEQLPSMNSMLGMSAFSDSMLRGIDWPRVMQEFDGIEMPHYSHGWSFEEGTQWTYGWDCASGCVWNAKDAVRVLKTTKRRGRAPSKHKRVTINE